MAGETAVIVPEELVDKELSPRQSRFVLAYLDHENAARAAREAGYAEGSASESGSRLLGYPCVQRALRAAKRDLALGAGMTRHRIVRKLWRVARMGLGDVATATTKGRRKLANLAAANRALETIARMCGFLTDHVDVTSLGQSIAPPPLSDTVARFAGEVAAMLASHGDVIDAPALPSPQPPTES